MKTESFLSALWELAFRGGPVTLSVEGKGPDVDVVTCRGHRLEGNYGDEEFATRLVGWAEAARFTGNFPGPPSF